MSDDFHFDVKRNGKDFPAFVEGKRVGVNERGEHYVVVGGRKWILDPNEAPLEIPDDPEQFSHFPPPPRQITLLGRLSLHLGAGIPGLLLFGCIFACFGMMFVCFTGSGVIDAVAPWKENGEARITAIDNANLSVNDASVYAYSFSGTDANGNEVTGISYQTHDQFTEGQTVPLQHVWFFGEKWKLENAAFSKVGGDRSILYIGLGVLIFPIVGVSIIFFGVLLPGLKYVPLVIHGESALASFLRQESTNTFVNDRTVQKLVFQFETPDGEQFEASLKTLKPDEFLRDSRRKIVFYNPNNPKKNMVWDSVTSVMQFDEFQQRFTGFTTNILVFAVFFAVFSFEIVWLFHNIITGTLFF